MAEKSTYMPKRFLWEIEVNIVASYVTGRSKRNGQLCSREE